MINNLDYLTHVSMSLNMFALKNTESFTSCQKILLETWSFTKFYLFWIIIHFAVSNLYTYLCTPLSLWGFIWSPFMAVVPHCKGMQWLFNISTNTISHMWTIVGVWFSAKLVGAFRGINTKPSVVKEFVYPAGPS